MTGLYMITGFLGAGKTTFLNEIIKLFPDQRISIIVNEFGRNSVDSVFLQASVDNVTEINNGSIFCSCKAEQFEAAILNILQENNPDLIFVEASGLADPSEVKSIFTSDIYRDVIFLGTICIVDAVRFHKIYETTKVCKMQLAISDIVLINKTDIADDNQIEGIWQVSKAQKPERPVYKIVYGQIQKEWLDELHCITPAHSTEPVFHLKDLNLQKKVITISGFSKSQLGSFLKFFADETYRIKGFVQCDNELLFVDCVGPLVQLLPCNLDVESYGSLDILYGKSCNLPKRIGELSSLFPECEISFITE